MRKLQPFSYLLLWATSLLNKNSIECESDMSKGISYSEDFLTKVISNQNSEIISSIIFILILHVMEISVDGFLL